MKNIFRGIVTCLGFFAFFIMVSVNPEKENWIKVELFGVGLFLLAFLLFAIVEYTNFFKKHFYACSTCFLAFCYRDLNIKTKTTRKCNDLLWKKMGYKDVYKYCIEKYNNKEEK